MIHKKYEREQMIRYERQLTIELNNFLVLSEEGDPTQIAFALCKAKREFLSLGAQMHHISEQIGDDTSLYVADYLESIDSVLHAEELIDEEVITHCLAKSAKLREWLQT